MKKLICLVTLLVIPSVCFAQDATEAVSRWKEACVFVTSEFNLGDINQPVKKYATGFIVDTTKSAGLIIVTNKHPLQLEVKGKLVKPSKIMIKVNMSEIEKTFYEADIIDLHDSYDIGLLLPKGLVNVPKDAELKVAGDKEYYAWKNRAILLEDSIPNDSDIKEGLEVFFSGYPLSLGTKNIKNYPITRKGIVAQVIPSENEFIVDGLASQGNSGSPIYCVIGNKIQLLGIQKGVYTDFTLGYDENGNLNSLVTFNSGLSIVIKSSVIKNFIYKLIEEGKHKGEWSN